MKFFSSPFRVLCALFATLFALVPSFANAAAVTLDMSEATTTISNGVSTLSAIGLAVLSLIVVTKMFKWAQKIL